MKFLAILAATLVPLLGFAQSVDKIYVNPSQIAVFEHEILAYIEGSWTNVEGICIDANGVYVVAKERDPDKYCWFCSRCGRTNPWRNLNCTTKDEYGRVCNAPRPW